LSVCQDETLTTFDTTCCDIYGRTLAWTWLTVGASDPLADTLHDFDDLGLTDDDSYEVLVDELMVRAGYARLYEPDPDVRYYQQLELALAKASSEGLGLWGECEE
jgi:hypothetical protein